jgi:hypothetical protein
MNVETFGNLGVGWCQIAPPRPLVRNAKQTAQAEECATGSSAARSDRGEAHERRVIEFSVGCSEMADATIGRKESALSPPIQKA